MTGGFGKGFVHGAMAATVIAGLVMLAAPRPERHSMAQLDAQTPSPAPPQKALLPDLLPENAPTVAPEKTVPAAPVDGVSDGAATDLPLPAGSEFRRGADLAPRAPDIEAAPERARAAVSPAAPVPDDASRAIPPLGEINARPVTALPSAAPAAPHMIEIAPDLPAMIRGETPIPVAPPGRVTSPALDRLPDHLPEPPPAAALARDNVIAGPSAGAGLPPAPNVPAVRRPAPNLAIPPDLARLAGPGR